MRASKSGSSDFRALQILTNPSRANAKGFFRRAPRWLRETFSRSLMSVRINGSEIVTKIPADRISPVPEGDHRYFISTQDVIERESFFKEKGLQAIKNSKLMTIKMAAGMATNFGGGAKAVVEVKPGMTFLDYHLVHTWKLQQEAKGHLIAPILVSGETQEAVLQNLGRFCRQRGIELITISNGDTQRKVESIWKKYQSRWDNCMIVPIIKQPQTLLISKDGTEVGSPYMGGHGDLVHIIKHQLAKVIKTVGADILMVSNIDNTGAIVAPENLGAFIEQTEQAGSQAMLEVARKSNGDKGGAIALIDGKLAVLEGPMVPSELCDQYKDVNLFPFFSTNTLYFLADALLNTEFELPLLLTKTFKEEGKEFLKIETIIGHALNSLRWKALVAVRGLRFNPVKYLPCRWAEMSDWMEEIKGIKGMEHRIAPVMRDGVFVPMPRIGVSESIFKDIEGMNEAIWAGGSRDSMAYLNSLTLGGEGREFHQWGKYLTRCGVIYRGDNLVIFGRSTRKSSGTLVVYGAGDLPGASELDRVIMEDSIVYVKPGRVLELNHSIKDQVPPEVSRDMLHQILNAKGTWAEDKWPQSERDRIEGVFAERLNH